MRKVLLFAALSLAISAPAFATADSFNWITPEVSTGYNDIGWSYTFKSDGAKQVLAQLRTVCASDNRFDQRRCARGTSILKKAYTEMLLRRAAQDVVAD